MNPRHVWPSVVLAAVAILAATIMALGGVAVETIVLVLGMLVTPILGALLAGQVAEVRGRAEQVVQQTNGTQARIIDILEAQGKMLAAMHPVAQRREAGEPPEQLAA